LFQEDALKANLVASKNDLEWSMDKLNKTSRSFSAVIVQLPEELRHAVSMFYLTLRALDTIGK
jgi:farnesyl-diphosphate farnesyltransferase